MSTQAPKCKVCHHRHRLGDPHIWEDVATIKPKSVKNIETSPQKSINVATIRQVSIRELNQGISGQFADLPFEVTNRGIVIARVLKP